MEAAAAELAEAKARAAEAQERANAAKARVHAAKSGGAPAAASSSSSSTAAGSSAAQQATPAKSAVTGQTPAKSRPTFEVTFPPGPLGMGLLDGPEGFVAVGDVTTGGTAASQGVVIGCYIVAVNGDALTPTPLTLILSPA